MVKIKFHKILLLSFLAQMLFSSCMLAMEQSASSGEHRPSIRRTRSMNDIKRAVSRSRRNRAEEIARLRGLRSHSDEVKIDIHDAIVKPKTFWQKHKKKIILGVGAAVLVSAVAAECYAPGSISGPILSSCETVKSFFVGTSCPVLAECPALAECPEVEQVPCACPLPECSAEKFSQLKVLSEKCVDQLVSNPPPLANRLVGEIVPKECLELQRFLGAS